MSALGQKTTWQNMFLSQYTIFPSGSITLVSVVISGKKLLGNPKLPKVSTYMVARLRT